MRAIRALTPEVLILGSRFDLTCDYVVRRLRERRAKYFRLNTEDLASLELELRPTERVLRVRVGITDVLIDEEHLRSVYFRRPAYLRTYGPGVESPDERFAASQWAAFMRSLMVFDSALWVNHPQSTYWAEVKPVQLAQAAKVGFALPPTLVTNTPRSVGAVANAEGLIAVKGLDTVLVDDGSHSLFGYTTLLPAHALRQASISGAPLTVQTALTKKLDIRVTVVGDDAFATSITDGDTAIEGNWRLHGKSATFASTGLPETTREGCIALTKILGLRYSAIDLAQVDETYYFLELNPTGEWAWLTQSVGHPIDEKLAGLLTCD